MKFAKRSVAIALAAATFAVAPAAAKTLVHCAVGSPEGFDPAPFVLDATLDVSEAIYDRLVAFRPGTTEIAPGLASNWEISDDGLEYTFQLRPDVSFHTSDGFTPTRALNADDVIFSFERQWREDHPYFDYSGGLWPFFTGLSMPETLRDVRKADEMTVVFVLNRPDAAFLSNLALGFASILSQEYADALLEAGERERLNQAPVGTGPFRLAEHDADMAVRLAANPDYWNGAPAIDELVLAATPDSAVRVAKLAAGDCDIAAAPEPADLDEIPQDASITVLQRPGAMITYLAYNTTQPPFDRAEVRRALNMAVNKQAVIDSVFGGQAIPAITPIPPDFGPYDDTLFGQSYDPEEAEAVLSEAGVNGLSLRILPLPTARPFNPDPVSTAAMIRADLATVGVNAEIVDTDFRDFLEQSADPERNGAVIFGWRSDNGDPDNFLSAPLGCDAVGVSNRAHWCNPGFEALIRKGRGETTPEGRNAAYRDALAIFVEEAPWLPIAHALVTAAVSDRVEGFVVDPLGRYRFDTVSLADD